MKYCHLHNMDEPREYYTKSDREMLYGIIYTWNLKNNTKEYLYKTETGSQTKKRNL